MPCVPFVKAQGGVPQVGAVMLTGRAAIVRETAKVLQDAKVSQARTVKFAVPLPLGVPWILQFTFDPHPVLLSVKPAGKLPTEIFQV